MKVAILFSGRGSNMRAVLQRTFFRADVTMCITDNSMAKGIEIVNEYKKTLMIIEKRKNQTKEDFDNQLADALDFFQIDLVVLAGFMRVLSSSFCERFVGRCINVHPSLLPKYKGLHTHERALQNNDDVHGCSVHFVTEQLDEGPLIVQAVVSVYPYDTPFTLADRVLKKEHHILPMAIQMLADGSIKYYNGSVLFNGVDLNGKPAYIL